MPLSLSCLALAQGAYFLATGIWPLVHMQSFEAVTGPKTDHWLVKTVGVLVAVMGAALILAGLGQEIGPATIVVATGSALGLAGIDVWYVARKVIRPIYLLDAVAEIGLMVGWMSALFF